MNHAPLPWFADWLVRHLKRHDLLGLPAVEANPELYDGWEGEFTRLRIAEEQAEAASRKLLGRRANLKFHFSDLVRLALDKPAPLAVFNPEQAGPDYSKPEALTPEQRVERIRLIRHELPTIELNAATYTNNRWFAAAADAARVELARLLEIEHEHHEPFRHPGRRAFPSPY